MTHKQLTAEQRYQIYGLWRAGYNQVPMANELVCINQQLVVNLKETPDGMATHQGRLNGSAMNVGRKLKSI